MANLKNTLAGFLQESRTLIDNAGAIPEVAAVLATYGYDGARLGEGLRLWAEVDGLSKKQALENGSRREIGQDFDKAWEGANAAYMKTLKVARVALGDEAKAVAALKLYGPRKQSFAGWLDQVGTMYANLIADPSMSAKLRRFGYTSAKIAAESALIDELRMKYQARAGGKGAAQSATAARDKKLAELDAWVSELRTISRVAFYENPQELEKLGLFVLNGSRRARKGTRATASGATPS